MTTALATAADHTLLVDLQTTNNALVGLLTRLEIGIRAIGARMTGCTVAGWEVLDDDSSTPAEYALVVQDGLARHTINLDKDLSLETGKGSVWFEEDDLRRLREFVRQHTAAVSYELVLSEAF